MATISFSQAQNTINYLRSLSRPLTSEEMKQGRRAALLIGRFNKERVVRSCKELKETMVQYFVGLGYNRKEALEAIRLDALESRENDGFGKSHRCRFVR